ncbi:hypothetical protein [Priestia taiwanensis]|uniref:Uncharacterized protein n=1 Tax=Priestia taiwanensis TaxID=1347902 RepID=A0A917ERI7_9BACI|nr:hypothetical protein [Priestia taiwanensis]MBM7364513.1 hypothetical protein [Priestia taiwanensis]GGE80915.1 hypothetical protein GCM10007140_33060 [Priestia taiwanensis]
MQQQNQTYQQPPNMITTKDFLYLEDMMNWNFIAMKKAHFYARHIQDAEVKSTLEKVGQMHQDHYMRILQHMQSTPVNQNAGPPQTH